MSEEKISNILEKERSTIKGLINDNKECLKIVNRNNILYFVLIVLLYFSPSIVERLNVFNKVTLMIYVTMLIFIEMYFLYQSFKSIQNKFDIERNLNRLENDLDEIESQIEYERIDSNKIEERAQNQFKQHQKYLNKYYSENIKQIKGVYVLGLITIFVGIFFILGTLTMCYLKPELTKNYAIPIVGVLSGILSNFIGALFIKMYSETVKISTKFHNKLVYSNNLYFSNFLISKIKNENKREDTLCEVAKIIAENKEVE
ncbi:TRADD-N-associated membrane domain-containing protein [Clostridioides sp. ZZV15-6598]|uniref:TRADD-N-associated membrane domain-containing protein n=1 Tax=Clostridioides sp. ZZV15-6598 TaxID=2811501 RepID=UPI001D112FED|nr:hypothetical protein [Clostridioides sp. ZZV15-6598]